LTVTAFQVLDVFDLTPDEAKGVCKQLRHHTSLPIPTEETLTQTLSMSGGRLAYLNRISKARDMVKMARHMLAVEKGWLLSRIGLIQDCDDDVMDEVRPANIDAVHWYDAMIAKMEFLLLATPTRICENQAGTRAATGRG
jgi:hypothetical protein